MKKFIAICLVAVAAVGCSRNKSSQIEVPSGPVLVSPLSSGIDLNNLSDATVPAAFSSADIDWNSRKITMTVYSEDLYDAVEVNQMKKGDTLYYGGDYIVVDTVSTDKDVLIVNGDIDEGGAFLEAYAGGTYRAFTFDDHSLYSEVGKVTLSLDKNLKFTDCGTNPEDPSILIAENHQAYLDTVASYKKEFSCLDTVVEIEDSKVVSIVRRWIP